MKFCHTEERCYLELDTALDILGRQLEAHNSDNEHLCYGYNGNRASVTRRVGIVEGYFDATSRDNQFAYKKKRILSNHRQTFLALHPPDPRVLARPLL